MNLIYFSTVVRGADPMTGGELVCLDWDSKTVRRRVTIAATNPTFDDPNPRGSTRGGRGVAVVGERIYVASYHSLLVFNGGLDQVDAISHGNFVGLHELHPTRRNTIWVTSTAIDAVHELDLADRSVIRSLWPRDLAKVQHEYAVEASRLDKSADNRGSFLSGAQLKTPGHLHLNAVGEIGARIIGFFNRFGALVDLETGTTLLRDEHLRGGHNLVSFGDGFLLVNDTINRRVAMVDLDNGRVASWLRLMDDRENRLMIRSLDRRFFLRRAFRSGARALRSWLDLSLFVAWL